MATPAVQEKVDEDTGPVGAARRVAPVEHVPLDDREPARAGRDAGRAAPTGLVEDRHGTGQRRSAGRQGCRANGQECLPDMVEGAARPEGGCRECAAGSGAAAAGGEYDDAAVAAGRDAGGGSGPAPGGLRPGAEGEKPMNADEHAAALAAHLAENQAMRRLARGGGHE